MSDSILIKAARILLQQTILEMGVASSKEDARNLVEELDGTEVLLSLEMCDNILTLKAECKVKK